MKRVLDLVLASLGLLMSLPLLVIIGITVLIREGPPVFFKQERAGRHSRTFRLLKFRTMTCDVDQAGNLLPDDQRLTGLGRFLRRYSLDELPELWNVLRGDMSLVGPRPLPVRYLSRYTPTEARRHEVRPGVTGWSQVNGRNTLGWDDRLAMDVWYVDNHSLWLDIQILWRTLAVVVSGDGVGGPGTETMSELRPSALHQSVQGGAHLGPGSVGGSQ